MTSQIDQTLSKYITMLSEAEKKSVLLLLKTFLSKPENIDQYNKEIDEALAEESEGNYITHEEMRKISSEW